jgi:hypothetical protein
MRRRQVPNQIAVGKQHYVSLRIVISAAPELDINLFLLPSSFLHQSCQRNTTLSPVKIALLLDSEGIYQNLQLSIHQSRESDSSITSFQKTP